MDLKPLEGRSDAGAEMVVTHPGNGEPTDAVITLAGSDSKAWRAATKKVSDRSLARKAVSPNEAVGAMIDDLRENRAEVLAAVTISWRNVEENGDALKCSCENTRRLYASHAWLLEQVDAFVGKRANFFRSDDEGVGGGD